MMSTRASKPPAVRAILFDADGVIQRTRGNWREQFCTMLGREEHLETFIAELFAAEKPCLTGHADFENQVATVLDRWRASATVNDALSIWTNIEVDAEIIDTISAVRRSGIACYLASNQQAHRARYMAHALGYRAKFDRAFYSCHVGYAKPDRAYFDHVLAELGLAPDDVLFIDDLEPNVASAREAGIRGVHFKANAGVAALVQHLSEHGIRLA